jgi:hypothetical protein
MLAFASRRWIIAADGLALWRRALWKGGLVPQRTHSSYTTLGFRTSTMGASPTSKEFERGVRAFREREPRDAMYRVATFLVGHFWRQPRELADGAGVLLLTWNQALYRYGPPDFKRFEGFLERHADTLDGLRGRDISTLTDSDNAQVLALFDAALQALAIAEGKSEGTRSPVAVAKALHLMAPSFFPLWDKAIAGAYGCGYATDPGRAYLRFMGTSKAMVETLRDTMEPLLQGKTRLKVVDEYNYAHFTKKWA